MKILQVDEAARALEDAWHASGDTVALGGA